MIANLAILLIVIYQKLVSPFFVARCVFYPSCSSYAKTHIKKYGILRSFFPLLKRIFSCHPYSKRLKNSFWDPVE
ncbi:MAG: membrane protein insertion efficiency factor YidD [Candidatus Marinimicrobia bacterium]|nr:membrane protein insertion efficiency factor YidD [Candidatus Neomarinimicrobiota bacterium]|tara:strand:+ start:33712 stop:33936 length:225 start_codon:yes stop_codon:yes gene_type:complete